MIRNMSVDAQLREITTALHEIGELASDLQSRAILKEISEIQYTDLKRLSYEWIMLLEPLQAGERVTAEWLAARNNLLLRLRRFVLDAPNAREDD